MSLVDNAGRFTPKLNGAKLSIMMTINRQPSFTEHWETCDNSDCMLWMLYQTQYGDAGKLDKYVDWLRQYLMKGNEWLIESRLIDFGKRIVWSLECIERDLKTSRITPVEARHRRITGAWQTARYCSDFVLNAKVADVRLKKLWGRPMAADDVLLTDCDETTIKRAGRKAQAAKLREIIEDPFVSATSEPPSRPAYWNWIAIS